MFPDGLSQVQDPRADRKLVNVLLVGLVPIHTGPEHERDLLVDPMFHGREAAPALVREVPRNRSLYDDVEPGALRIEHDTDGPCQAQPGPLPRGIIGGHAIVDSDLPVSLQLAEVKFQHKLER